MELMQEERMMRNVNAHAERQALDSEYADSTMDEADAAILQ